MLRTLIFYIRMPSMSKWCFSLCHVLMSLCPPCDGVSGICKLEHALV